MTGLLSNFRNTIIVSVLLALVIAFGFGHSPHGFDEAYFQAVFRLLHASEARGGAQDRPFGSKLRNATKI